MDIIENLYNEINKNTNILGFLISFFSVVFLSLKYLSQKKQELDDRRFVIYHQLIKEFVGQDSKEIKLDYQIVICYELRNFKKYYPVTKRILSAFQVVILENKKNNRLYEEIELTIDYINTSWLKRKVKDICK